RRFEEERDRSIRRAAAAIDPCWTTVQFHCEPADPRKILPTERNSSRIAEFGCSRNPAVRRAAVFSKMPADAFNRTATYGGNNETHFRRSPDYLFFNRGCDGAVLRH